MIFAFAGLDGLGSAAPGTMQPMPPPRLPCAYDTGDGNPANWLAAELGVDRVPLTSWALISSAVPNPALLPASPPATYRPVGPVIQRTLQGRLPMRFGAIRSAEGVSALYPANVSFHNTPPLLPTLRATAGLGGGEEAARLNTNVKTVIFFAGAITLAYLLREKGWI